MSKRDDVTRLRHMLDATRKAVEFTRGKSRRALDEEEILALALVRLLEITGEAARGLSSELTAAHSEMPWAQMAAMRNRLIHGYFDVDLDVVWRTVEEELPPLVREMERILEQESRHAGP